jgi:hypothetical protein
MNKNMPWTESANKFHGQDRINHVIKIKKELHISRYGPDIPGNIFFFLFSLDCITRICNYVQTLAFSEKPDYKKIMKYIDDECLLKQIDLT